METPGGSSHSDTLSKPGNTWVSLGVQTEPAAYQWTRQRVCQPSTPGEKIDSVQWHLGYGPDGASVASRFR
ncbi:MAG: hypothetical protein AAFY83_06915 [Pseudomonadota bacterium]